MDTEQLQEGTLLNARYRIRCALGQGGMGTVYMAEHVRLESIVAVKEVRGSGTTEEQFQAELQQVEQEARFLVHLNHPNLPKVNDAFIENDRFYLVMEYVEGVTLDERLEQSAPYPLDVEQVVGFALQIADVLYYLHTQEPPIIFRDLKPSNVMVQPDNTIRLIDFGIARRFQPGATKDTSLLGSVGYSPPEQFGKHQTEPRSDIYAFGATLHHLLTRRDPVSQPFKFPPARSLNAAVPESLSRLLDECLAMDPSHRPNDMNDVAARLIAIHDELMNQAAYNQTAGRNGSGAMARGASSGNMSAHERVISSGRFGSSARVGGGTGGKMPASSARIVGSEVGSGRMAHGQAGHSSAVPVRPPVQTGQPFGARNAGSRKSLIAAVAVVLLFSVGIIGYKVLAKPVKPTMKTKPANSFTDTTTSKPTATDDAPPAVAPVNPARSDTAPASDADLQAAPQPLMSGVNGLMLPLVVTGVVHNHPNENGTVAAFFYDENDAPIQDVKGYPNSAYANPKGQLSVANSLVVTSDSHPFSLTLSVPMQEFPLTIRAIKFRCKVFLNNAVVGQTDIQSIPNDLFEKALVPETGNPNAGNPGDTGQPPSSDGTQPPGNGNTGNGGTNPRSSGGGMGMRGIGHP